MTNPAVADHEGVEAVINALDTMLDGVTSIDKPREGCIGFFLPDYNRVDEAGEKAIALIRRLEAERDEWERIRSDPAAVHLNMLRGSIAKPSLINMLHLEGDEAVRKWYAAEEAWDSGWLRPDGRPQPVESDREPSREVVVDAKIAFLTEAARYFERRPTGGEDSAHWANVFNAKNCRETAELLRALQSRAARWEKAARAVTAEWMSEAAPSEPSCGGEASAEPSHPKSEPSELEAARATISALKSQNAGLVKALEDVANICVRAEGRFVRDDVDALIRARSALEAHRAATGQDGGE